MFYKYRSINSHNNSKTWTKSIIENNSLYFSSIEAFNDPFDGRVFLRTDGSANEVKSAIARVQYTMRLKGLNKLEGMSLQQANSLAEEVVKTKFDNKYSQDRETRLQELHNRLGVLSLSSVNDNILMWSHYSDDHKGICIGFDWSSEPENSMFSNENVKKVRYQTHYDDVWLWLHTDEEIIDRILYSKSIDWQYEQEFRIVSQEPGIFQFSKDCIKEIIFGCKVTEEDKTEIVSLAKANGLEVKFKQAEMDVAKYKLNVIDYENGK